MMNTVPASFALGLPLTPRDHTLGPADAPVTVVEYGDFECPSSFEAYRAMKLLYAHYGRHMVYAFRHAPSIELHPHAGLAAQAAEAAGAQGKFWEMHDQLFDHREHLNPHELHGYAEELELDMRRFDSALKHQVFRPCIDEQIEGGRLSGVAGTPTFFVDGVLVDIVAGLRRLLEAIDLRLHLALSRRWEQGPARRAAPYRAAGEASFLDA